MPAASEEGGVDLASDAVEEDCLYLEASTPELDDVIRIQDDFNRQD